MDTRRIVKTNEARTRPKKAWEETRESFKQRMADIVRDINQHCDVDGLCRSFRARLAELVEKGGDRLVRGNTS